MPENTKKLSRDIRSWIFSLIGAGIGAGILFLSLETAEEGFLLSVLALLISYPIVYYAQKYLIEIFLKTENIECINDAIQKYLGKIATIQFSILYSLMTFVWVAAYAIGINTTIETAAKHFGLLKTDLSNIEFSILAFIILSIFTIISLLGEKVLIRILSILTLILIVFILVATVLFIPEWNLSRLFYFKSGSYSILSSLLILIPIFVFAISVIQPLSPLTCFFRNNYKLSQKDLRNTSLKTYKIGFFFFVLLVALFTFSITLSLSQSAIAYAKVHNLSALVVIENNNTTSGNIKSILEYMGLGITFFALITSYYGIGFGFIDTIAGSLKIIKLSYKKRKYITIILFNFLLWIFTSLNLSIIHMIGELIVPCMGIIAFILPAVIIIINKDFKNINKIIPTIIMLSGIFLIVSFFIGFSMK